MPIQLLSKPYPTKNLKELMYKFPVEMPKLKLILIEM